MIEISIIIPVFNVEKYLEECLDSVWVQYNEKIEVIAINDGSTDDSLAVLRKIKSEHPALCVFSQDNHGLGAVRNLGIKMAQGKYIYFLDADDCLEDGALKRVYEISEKRNLDILLFDAVVFGELKEELDVRADTYMRKEIIGEQTEVMKGIEFLNRYYPAAYTPSACLVFLKRDFLLENNITFEEGTYYEDIGFHNKLIFCAERVQYISDCLYKRRYRVNSIMTSAVSEKKAENLLRVIECCWNDALETGIYETTCLKGTGILQSQLIVWANMCSSLLIKRDDERIRKGYALAKRICGETIEEWNSYKDLEFMYQLYKIFDFAYVSDDLCLALLKKREEFLKKILVALPLSDKRKNIGIYGTGVIANRLLDSYVEVIGDIKAEIYFINSMTEGTKKYRDRPLISINDLGNYSIDYILIASRKYEKEMSNIIRQLYGSRYEVICVASEYGL